LAESYAKVNVCTDARSGIRTRLRTIRKAGPPFAGAPKNEAMAWCSMCPISIHEMVERRVCSAGEFEGGAVVGGEH